MLGDTQGICLLCRIRCITESYTGGFKALKNTKSLLLRGFSGPQIGDEVNLDQVFFAVPSQSGDRLKW